MASKTKGRKRARKGQNGDEPAPVRLKDTDEFATALEEPFAIEGATLGHGKMELEAGLGMLERGGGKKEGTLKWVQASNGDIPDDAVEGGWRHSTKEKVYVARAKDHTGALVPGALRKSDNVCTYCMLGNKYHQTSVMYEVLVNPGNRADVQWVTSKAPVPPNSVEGGFSTPGKTLYIGRQSTKKDIIPGYIDPDDGMLHIANEKYKGQTYKTFEVLVISGDVEIIEEVNRCTLEELSYDVRQSDLTEERVVLTTMMLENRSSLEQSLSSTVFVEYSKLYDWNIGKKTSYSVEIKGGVPYLFGSDGDVSITDDGGFPDLPNNVSNPTPMMTQLMNNRQLYTSNNRQLYRIPILRGGVLGQVPAQQPHYSYGVYIQPGETPTAVTMKLGKALRNEVAQEKEVQCIVGPNSKVTVEMIGLQRTVEVPFTGKMRKVFKNGMSAEEDVDGTYTYCTMANIVPAMVKEEKLEA